MYRSNTEKEFAEYLDKERIVFDYEKFKLPYVVSHHYYPDFFLKKYGFFIEYKGYFKAADRKKHLLIRKQHPDLDLRFLFMNANNKLYKGSKTTYSKWCERYDIPWCQGFVPKEWLE